MSAKQNQLPVPALCATTFSVGDCVAATGFIIRKDQRAELKPGDRATVRSVVRVAPDRPQIIDLTLSDGSIMMDIVCFENVPLRLVRSAVQRIQKGKA